MSGLRTLADRADINGLRGRLRHRRTVVLRLGRGCYRDDDHLSRHGVDAR